MDSHNLAARVRDELIGAGLPLAQPFLSVNERYRVGASVEIEGEGGDESSVFVSWQADRDLVDKMSEALLQGNDSAGAVIHHGRVVEAMTVAMRAILESAGFRVQEAADEDEYRPFELRVVTAPSG